MINLSLNTSLDIAWLYSCKVARDSSTLYITGSVNFDFVFFAAINASTGDLNSFMIPDAPYQNGIT